MADNTIAYYEDGVPHSADGKVVIVIDGKMPVDTGAGGTGGGGGGKVGGTSESSAAIHATAKWSTAQLKKTLAEKAARERETAAAMAAAKAKRDALTQHLKDIVNDVLRHNASRTPSATDLAHANNMAMQAEAQRLGRAKAEEKARKEAEAAELAFQEAERQREEAVRQLAETERQLKQAEEEKRLAALSDEARAVENARKNLDTAKSELANVDSDIERQRSQLSSLDADVKKAEENLRLTMRIKGRIGRKMQAKSQAIVDDKKRIYSDAENVLNTMTVNRNLKAQQVTDAENELKVAIDNLNSSQMKNAVDATVSFYQTLTEKYGEKYSLIAQELAEKSKGKKIGNVDEALAAFEKYKDVLDKKFSKADRDAIVNALKSFNYDDWAKHLDQFAKYLKITGHVSFGYDVVSDVLKASETGDWKPLFITLEQKVLDTGMSYLVVLMFSLIAGTTLGIFGVAIITAILCSFVDKYILNALNDALGI
ncbi:colicin-10 [Salmonella enterica]|nr:colicin-10 [Salmonella enterica]EBH6331462.1 colicin-10 [Salmonella enterica]ELX7911369.1 colicin-10 [Salmonella enterica]OIN35410.1 colicin-10 [Salmonella enterica subsp. enterica serovar Sarajane]